MSFVYVTLLGSGEVVKYNTLTGTIEGRQSIGVDGKPYEISVTENNVLVYDAWQNTPDLIEIEDVDPNQFYFTIQESVERSTTIYTNIVTISGLTNETIASVPDIFSATIILNGTDSGQQAIVNNGDLLQIRYETPVDPNVVIKIPVFIGSTSTTIETVTKEIDETIDQFIFNDINIWENDTSNEITISGIDPDVLLPFTIDRGEIIHNSIPSGLSVNVAAGDTISIRVSNQVEQINFVNIQCANHDDIIATLKQPSDIPRPNINTFEDVTNVLPNTGHESETVIVSGLGEFKPEPTEFDEEGNPIIPPAIPNTFSVTLEPYTGAYIIKNGQNVGQSTTFIDGDTYSIYGLSNPNEYSSRTIGIYGDGWVSTFTIINEPDQIPDTVSFSPIIDANVRSVVSTETFTITGLSEGIEIDIEIYNKYETLLKFLQPIFFVNNEPFIGNLATVKNGDEVRIEVKVVGAVWGGDKLFFDIRKPTGFVIGRQRIFTGYLDGISNQMYHPIQKVFNEGDIFEYADTSKKLFEVEKTFEYADSSKKLFEVESFFENKKSSAHNIIENDIVFERPQSSKHIEFDQPTFAAATRSAPVIEVSADIHIHSNKQVEKTKEVFFEKLFSSYYDSTIDSEYDLFTRRDIKFIAYTAEKSVFNNKIFADLVQIEYFKPTLNGESYIDTYYIVEEKQEQKNILQEFFVEDKFIQISVDTEFVSSFKDNSYEVGTSYQYHGYNTFNEVSVEYILHQKSHKEYLVEFLKKGSSVKYLVDNEFISNKTTLKYIVGTEFEKYFSGSVYKVQSQFDYGINQTSAIVQSEFDYGINQTTALINQEAIAKEKSIRDFVDMLYRPNFQQELKLIDMVYDKFTLFQREVLNDALPQVPHIPDNYKELGSTDGTAENPDYEFVPDYEFEEVVFDPNPNEPSLPEYSPGSSGTKQINYVLQDNIISSTEIMPKDQETNIGVFAGVFSRGPMGQAVLISSQEELESTFGKPSEDFYNDWYQCYNFLEYGSTKLYVVRLGRKIVRVTTTEL